jgi:hypothetical protein
MQDILNSLVKSRRFWATVASIAVIAFKDKLPIPEDQITNIVLAIGAWVAGESLRSSQKVAE